MKKTYVLLAVILVLAALARFPYADLNRMGGEMVRDISIAERIDNSPIFHGLLAKNDAVMKMQTFGPLYYYLIWLSLQFTDHVYYYPLQPYFLTMFLNVISVALCFWFCQKYFGQRVALFATVLYAVSPWVVIQVSNVFTNPNFLPPFVLLGFIAYYKVFVENKYYFLLLLFASVALQLQLHLSSLLLIPVYASLFFLKPALFKRKETYLSGLVALLIFFPGLVFMVTNSNYSVFSFIGGRPESMYLTNIIDASVIPVMYTTPYLGRYLLGDSLLFHTQLPLLLYYGVTVISVMLFILGLALIVKKLLLSKWNDRKLIPLFIWLVFPVFLAFVLRKNISPHYLVILLPSQFIVLAILWDVLLKKSKLFMVPFFLIVLYSLLFITHFYSLMEVEGTDGILGIPYKHKAAVVDYLASHSNTEINVSYYPTSGSTIDYLLVKRGKTPHSQIIWDVRNFSRGFLLVNPLVFQGYGEMYRFTDADRTYLNKYTHIKINSYVIYYSKD